MHRALGVLAVAALLATPSVVQAQRLHMQEIGVDATLGWVKPSGSDASLKLMTPVDVRIGFMGRGPLTLEPRFSLFLQADGGTRYAIDPGVNVLYRLSGRAINRNTYATVGADIDFIKSGESGAVFGLNGGVGMRRPWGTGAVRTEFFLRYAFEDTAIGAPNTFSLGVRFGLSMWH